MTTVKEVRNSRGRGRGRSSRPERQPDGLFPPLGYTIRHAVIDDLSYPVMVSENLVKNRNVFTAREDDVMVVTYPRSGTTWTLDIVRYIHLAQRPALPPDHPLRSENEVTAVPWINRGKDVIGIDEKESPRVMKSHNHYIHLNVPEDFKQLRVIHVMRNPKDVLCSLYHHCLTHAPAFDYQGTFGEFVGHFMKGHVAAGNYWDFNLGFLENKEGYNILYLTYEELSKDKISCIKKISEFLGYDSISLEQIEEVDRQTKFEVMVNVRKQITGDHLVGKTGRHKEMLSESQIADIDKITESKLYENTSAIDFIPKDYVQKA